MLLFCFVLFCFCVSRFVGLLFTLSSLYIFLSSCTPAFDYWAVFLLGAAVPPARPEDDAGDQQTRHHGEQPRQGRGGHADPDGAEAGVSSGHRRRLDNKNGVVLGLQHRTGDRSTTPTDLPAH